MLFNIMVKINGKWEIKGFASTSVAEAKEQAFLMCLKCPFLIVSTEC